LTSAPATRSNFPSRTRSFDLVLAYTIFSSILDRVMAANVASEITRVLRPGGGIVWYDFRCDSPSNRNVRGIGADGVRRLFPELHGELASLTLLPPVVRRLGFLTPVAHRPLALVPPVRSHLLGLLVKPAHAV
jgi:SAM-dependent methyltransferase